jgi:hypothetical protein
MSSQDEQRKPGRKTKLTDEVQERIVAAIRGGNYQDVAARYAGIGERTFYAWMERGEKGEEPYAQFQQAVESAKAVAEVRSVALIQKAAQDGSWQAAAWYLERTNAGRWGRKQMVSLTGEDGGPVKFEQVTPAEANRRLVAELDELASRRRKKANNG